MAKKHKKKKVYGFFPLFYPHLGTPKRFGGSETKSKTNPPGPGPHGQDAEGNATSTLSPATPVGSGGSTGAAGSGGGAGMTAHKDLPKGSLLDHLKRVFKPLQEMDPNWSGFQIASPLMIKTRMGGGPNFSGPGFDTVDKPTGGVYNATSSPGLGFSTEAATRVWKAAMDVMQRDKTLPPLAILQAGFARSGVSQNDLDPAETRLLSMGIEWVLSDQNVAQPWGGNVQWGTSSG